MKEVMRNLLICIGIFVAIMIIAAVIWICHLDYSSVIKANWKLTFPSDAKYTEIYSKDSGPSFHGDGVRYHIFSYKKAEPVREMFSWQQTEEKTRHHDSYSDAAEEWLDELEIPQKERPDYEKCFYWYKIKEDYSEIIIFWNEDQKKLYVVEQFL